MGVLQQPSRHHLQYCSGPNRYQLPHHPNSPLKCPNISVSGSLPPPLPKRSYSSNSSSRLVKALRSIPSITSSKSWSSSGNKFQFQNLQYL
ncbi:hypothetical protein Hanom_Chr16g01426601 [Helianthus anomalus]